MPATVCIRLRTSSLRLRVYVYVYRFAYYTRTVVQSVLKATKQVNGKGQNSTLRHTKTPKPIFTKIGMRDYVMDSTRHAKFCIDRFRGFCSPDVILPCFWGD